MKKRERDRENKKRFNNKYRYEREVNWKKEKVTGTRFYWWCNFHSFYQSLKRFFNMTSTKLNFIDHSEHEIL